MIEQKNNTLYLRDLTARTKSSVYSVALSAVRFAAEPIRIGSPCRRSTAKRSTHLAQTVGPEEEGKKEESQSRVLSTFAAGISRCASRLDEFTHEQAAPTRPRGFLESRGAASLNLHFICFRSGCPFFFGTRSRTYTRAARKSPDRFPRRMSPEKSPSNENRRADNPLRRMRRANERCATASMSSILTKLMRAGTPSKTMVATYMGHRNFRISYEA